MFGSRATSKAVKVKICKTMVILMTWERKILRKIYGPTKENGQWRIKTNEELINTKPQIL
jgi:hypothetical protein